MLKKISVIILILAFFGLMLLLLPRNKECCVKEVISPVEFVFKSGEHFKLEGFEYFDNKFSERNKILAEKFNMSEEEAFIFGNLSKYWAKNLLTGRSVKQTKDDLIFNKYGYKKKFENSAFCIKDGEFTNKAAYERQLKTIRRAKFVILDTNSETVYPISKEVNINDFIVIRKTHAKKLEYTQKENDKTSFNSKLILDNVKIILSDFTVKLKPDRNCSSEICQEILSNINNAKSSIDFAIYGYSTTYAIENALRQAIKRGVKVRLVYDVDSKGGNIYPNTFEFVKMFPSSVSDKVSKDSALTMHNKFYIFDDNIVITGSANLSHTDMSGYNSNSIMVIKSSDAAKIYKQEFEQMYSGKFHSEKISYPDKVFENMKIYFSPQDKAITNGVLPLIKNAKKYIYIPTFVITERRVVEELINARRRGVDVKIIVDALNASNKYSKHSELRAGGVPVKTENYAGKMHSKSMIIDDEYLIIGSMNFSNSGEKRNDENMIVYKNSEAAKFYKDFFLYQWNKIPDKWLKFSARAEGLDSIGSCSDGIDNNYDGLIDKDDPACRKAD